MTDELEKAQLGAGTFSLFCNQFGEDVYAQILLEVILEGIINAESLFIFGEQIEEGDQVSDGSAIPTNGQLNSE